MPHRAQRFQSTLPARGATNPRRNHARQQIYFNPRSPHGERPTPGLSDAGKGRFQSTLPARGATVRLYQEMFGLDAFQSTLPARGATPEQAHRRACAGISIHAPRTGSDRFEIVSQCISAYFNPRSPHGERPRRSVHHHQGDGISIHAPRTGSDRKFLQRKRYEYIFQSTLPARGATRMPRSKWPPPCNFNPRSPHGERQALPPMLREALEISIHAPRTGSDHPQRVGDTNRYQFQSTFPARGATAYDYHAMRRAIFQSTLPARGATVQHRRDFCVADISIHAPRTGSDTTCARVMDRIPAISIHAPRTGSDVSHPFLFISGDNFNPRSPHGERRGRIRAGSMITSISIHAPRTGSDKRHLFPSCREPISIHAPRTGSDSVM